MKILHLLQSNRFSGAENVVLQIMGMFRGDSNIEMVYCCPDGPIREVLAGCGIPFVPVKKMSLFEIRRVIREVKPTIIHAHDMRASFLTALVCGCVPFVSHIHNNNFDSRKMTAKTVLYSWAARRARHIFWVSKSAFEGYYYRLKIAAKSSVLRNVVDTAQIRERAASAERQDTYDVVYIGRLSYPKDPKRVIRVLEAVAKLDPSIRAAVVGNGEMAGDVRRLVEKSDVKDQIQLLGFIENPLGIMKNAKVMIMTSLWEGMPISALEAMTLGVPLVCVPTDGLRELIVHGETGYLSDNDDELVRQCYKIICEAETRERMSREAVLRICDLMDLSAYHDRVSQVYNACIKKDGRRRETR